nr:zinc ribbon domain-containing protein [Spirulina subsalsa]
MLCKPTLDAGFGGFLEVLKHVAWKRDVYLEKVDANFTSQICPSCGVVTGKKDLSQRVHVHFVTLREVNANGDVPKKTSRASRRNRKAS